MTTKHSFINWKGFALLAICGATAFGLSIYLHQRVQRPMIGGVRTRLQCLRDFSKPDLLAPVFIFACMIAKPKPPPSPVDPSVLDPSVYPRRSGPRVLGSETTTSGQDAAERQ